MSEPLIKALVEALEACVDQLREDTHLLYVEYGIAAQVTHAEEVALAALKLAREGRSCKQPIPGNDALDGGAELVKPLSSSAPPNLSDDDPHGTMGR